MGTLSCSFCRRHRRHRQHGVAPYVACAFYEEFSSHMQLHVGHSGNIHVGCSWSLPRLACASAWLAGRLLLMCAWAPWR